MVATFWIVWNLKFEVRAAPAFGVTEGYAFLVARSKGAPIVAFGAGFLETPVVFYALEKSGIHTPGDLVGKRVGRRAGTDMAIAYDALLIRTSW